MHTDRRSTNTTKKTNLAASVAAGLGMSFAMLPAVAGTVSGKLTFQASGQPVAHATVSLAGTPYAATTDAQGRYTIARVPAGTYTLTSSSGGASDTSQAFRLSATDAVTMDLALRKAVQLSGVTVAANRYDASSLQFNANRTVDVLSAKDLQTTAVHNVAEALGLMPGVNVTTTGTGYFGGVDGAARGEGMFTSVRGLPSEYNVNLIDGVDVAQGMPYSRSVQLSLLPPSGLQTIVLNKTSTADMDGDAIGGTIDFRTPTAFDIDKPTSGSITVSGRSESRARDYGGSGLGGGLAAEFQTKFGAQKQVGVYASAYYDYRNVTNSEVGAAESALNDGSWAFAHASADGGDAAGYDPARNLSSIGMNVGVAAGYERRYGSNFSLDWKVDDSLTAYARATYAYALTDQDTIYNQLLPNDVSYRPAGGGTYKPVIGRIANRFWYETNPERADLATFQVGADKTAGGWTISPNVFYSFGDNDRPNHVEIDGREDKYSQANFAYGGSTLQAYGPGGFPYPQLTPALLGSVNDIPGMWANDYGELTRIFSGQKKGGAKLDFRYDFDDGALSSIQFGLKYSDSSRRFTNRDWSTAGIDDGTTTLGDLGIFGGNYASIFPGKYRWSTPKVNEAAVSDLIYAHLQPGDLDTCGSSYWVNNYNCNSMRGTEAVSAAYAMATFDVGALEIQPGVRFEHTSIRNTFWVTPADADGNELPGYFSNNRTQYNEALPSLLLTYRPDESSVYRAQAWESYTRPAFVELGGGSQISVSRGVTTITQGNPDLKPIKSTNLDLSAQWLNDRGGFASVAAYYKRLHDYIYDNGAGQVNPNTSGSGAVLYKMPSNGGDGHVEGLELTFRQKFLALPSPWDGFGISLNATRQNSRVDLGLAGFDNERLQSAPRTMGNAELFYEKNGLSINLSYHYTGAYLLTYDYLNQGSPWDDLWVRPIRRVDLHAGYRFSDALQLDLSISNLTNQYSYWSHIGRESLAISDIVDAGRTTLLQLKYSF